MRISELLNRRVVDQAGATVGHVRDVRIIRRTPAAADAPSSFQITGVVVGGGPLAHAWGFAESRATGPWLLRTLTARSARQARFLATDQIHSWGPDVVVMRGRLEDLPRLIDELQQ